MHVLPTYMYIVGMYYDDIAVIFCVPIYSYIMLK